MAFYPAGGKTYNLQSSIGSTDTTITLTSFLEPVTNVPYTMALLNTLIVFATIAPKTTSSEFISFTGITQNSDGTATLTGVTRGLAKKYPFTTDVAYKLPHSGQSQFILSDAPQVFVKYASLDNDNAFLGYNTGPDPLSAQGYVTRDYMLALINGGTISINSVIEAGTAGETLVAGNLVYFSEVDNEWLKTDADTLATVFNVKLGIAQGSGVNGGAITGGVLTFGTYVTSGLTQGDLCFASNTAGGINSGTAGTTPRVIGIAKDSTHLYFDPNFQNFLYSYAVDAVGTDSYAVTLAGAFGAYYPGMIITFKAGTANTGACTLNVNGLGAKSIKKEVNVDMVTGDILANQIVQVQYDGTNFQILSKTPLLTPIVRTYLNAGSPATWTKPAGLRYVIVEVQAGGGNGSAGAAGTAGAGGGGGGYSRKLIAAATLGTTETVTTGAAAGASSFGAHATATAGGNASTVTPGTPGIGSSGDLNISGQGGLGGSTATPAGVGGLGGSSCLGGGGFGAAAGDNAGGAGGVYGGGGGGGGTDFSGAGGGGGGGAAGIVIVTEYYS